MASIGEIANESKAILEDIRTNTLGTRNNTSQMVNQLNDLKAEVTHLDGTTQAGFANLAAGTGVLVQLGQQANLLSAENVEQNTTIICWLTKIAHVLCEMKHDLDASVVEQRKMVARLAHLDSVVSLVHSRETLEVASRDTLQAEIDACCRPEPPKPQPCFEDCKSPEIRPYKPVKTDWKPIVFNQPDVPR